MTRKSAYEHRQNDPAFAADWNNAIEEGIEGLEAEAISRARRMSDTLMIFMLKAHKPEKYRENVQHNHSGSLNLTFTELVKLATDEQQETSTDNT